MNKIPRSVLTRLHAPVKYSNSSPTHIHHIISLSTISGPYGFGTQRASTPISLSLSLSSHFLYFSLLGFLLCPLRDFDICGVASISATLKISLPIALSLLLSFCHFPENIPGFYGGPFSFSPLWLVT